MWVALGAAAWLVGSAIYRKLTEEEAPPKPSSEILIPRIEPGTAMPMLFGKYRVRQPVLAWHGPATFDTVTADGVEVRRELRMDAYYLLGLGFPHSTFTLASNGVHRIFVGDLWVDGGINKTLSDLTGNGSFEAYVDALGITGTSNVNVVGDVEFLNGGPAQVLVNSGASTYAGATMLADGLTETQIPGYRDLLSVCLFGDGGSFLHGNVTSIPAYQFEASSYHTNHSQLGTYCRVGDDSSAINALYCLLTNPPGLGGLGIPTDQIDISAFQDAQYILHTETHGYSMCLDGTQDAMQVIHNILVQIDGVLYEEPTTGEIVVKLIRADYDTSELLEINKTNCVRLEGFTLGGREGIVNKVEVVYADRESDYQDNSVIAQNPANAVAGDGQINAMVVRMPGVTSTTLAGKIANRILDTLSRPLMRCQAIVSREFLRVRPGDCVRLVYSNPDVANVVMRVLGVDLGALEDGAIALDLVQDGFYVWRGQTPRDFTTPVIPEFSL